MTSAFYRHLGHYVCVALTAQLLLGWPHFQQQQQQRQLIRKLFGSQQITPLPRALSRAVSMMQLQRHILGVPFLYFDYVDTALLWNGLTQKPFAVSFAKYGVATGCGGVMPHAV